MRHSLLFGRAVVLAVALGFWGPHAAEASASRSTAFGKGSSAASFADPFVGTGKAVTVAGVSLTGTDAANYTLAGLNAVSVDITPKLLTINGINATDRAFPEYPLPLRVLQ